LIFARASSTLDLVSPRAPLLLLALALTFARAPAARALEPDEVLILARGASADAKTVLDHYRLRRGVPKENVLALQVGGGETISRKEFERWVLAPLRAELGKPERARIRCLLVLRGLPLRVGPAGDPPRRGAPPIPLAEARRLESTVAAFDSEIALALAPPPMLEGWVANPFFRPEPGPDAGPWPSGPDRPLLVARLDGPSTEVAAALVDRAIAGEERGLHGLFCFDARGLKKDASYGAYDERIREAARLAREAGLEVRLEDTPELFQKGDCPETAFYIGWYSLGKYVDAFSFAPGAIAFHVASLEASSLQSGDFWVKGLLEHGAAASLGPTDEPFLASFPDPVAFLAHVLAGKETLAEIYWRTIPQASWRQVLVGDPLYRPRVPGPGK
jgi:uncharacterized protein (TIGR03790 family)